MGVKCIPVTGRWLIYDDKLRPNGIYHEHENRLGKRPLYACAALLIPRAALAKKGAEDGRSMQSGMPLQLRPARFRLG